MPKSKIAIIGAGWSGLAAACELVQRGYPVEIYEASTRAGGRARSFQVNSHTLDNGQHLIIGAYENLFQHLKLFKVDLDSLFHRVPFAMDIKSTNNHIVINANKTRLIGRILQFFSIKGFSWYEKFSLIRTCLSLVTHTKEMTLYDFFKKIHTAESIISHFFTPIIEASMTTPIGQASLLGFQRIFKDTFLASPEKTFLYFQKKDLQDIYPTHALKFLEFKGVEIHYRTRVTELVYEDSQIKGFKIQNTFKTADKVILACHPRQAQALYPHSNLSQLNYQPIVTFNYFFEDSYSTQEKLIGWQDEFFAWVFYRNTETGTLFTVVLSCCVFAPDKREQLEQFYKKKIIEIFQVQNCIFSKVITEKFAAIQADMHYYASKISPKTDVLGLYLTGDYTDTPYPSTLEGSLMSGIQTAALFD